MIAKATAIIVLLILLLIFAIQNGQPAVLHFLFRLISPSAVLFVLVSFMIGLLTGCILMLLGRKKKDPDYSFFTLWQFFLAQYYERILMGRTKSVKGE